MTVFALTMYHDHDPRVDTLAYGVGDQCRIKHLDSPCGVPDVLAWCSENDCPATPSTYPRHDSARVYIIVPFDDDAAFALRMRWM